MGIFEYTRSVPLAPTLFKVQLQHFSEEKDHDAQISNKNSLYFSYILMVTIRREDALETFITKLMSVENCPSI